MTSPDDWSDLDMVPSESSFERCSPVACDVCGSPSRCLSHDSVDVGVGVITGNHLYFCPRHGEFGEGGVFMHPVQDARCPDCDARSVRDIAHGVQDVRTIQELLVELLSDLKHMDNLFENGRPKLQIRLVVDAFTYERLLLCLPPEARKKVL